MVATMNSPASCSLPSLMNSPGLLLFTSRGWSSSSPTERTIAASVCCRDNRKGFWPIASTGRLPAPEPLVDELSEPRPEAAGGAARSAVSTGTHPARHWSTQFPKQYPPSLLRPTVNPACRGRYPSSVKSVPCSGRAKSEGSESATTSGTTTFLRAVKTAAGSHVLSPLLPRDADLLRLRLKTTRGLAPPTTLPDPTRTSD